MRNLASVLTSFSVVLVVFGSSLCGAAEIWTGPRIVFEKAAFTDPSDPANQDRITDNVWITRGGSAGIFNIASEAFYENFVSPADTEWAIGTTSDLGIPDFLEFENWQDTIGIGTVVNGPPTFNEQRIDLVMHLITDDIYIDVAFTSWGVQPSSGAFFTYERSTPVVPEPGTLALLAMVPAVVGLTRFRFSARVN